MMLKWIGAVFILISCGSFGIILSSNHKKEVSCLKKLIASLDFMECELQFHMLALPDLCRKTAGETDGLLRHVFVSLANELEDQISPDVRRCMHCALGNIRSIPLQTLECLKLLGDSLGRFDLEGQLKGLEFVRSECRLKLNKLLSNADVRIRSYQTIGICAGAALVILLM